MKEILNDINVTITNLEKMGFVKEAEDLDNVFIRIAQVFPGLGEAIQQVGPFAEFQKYVLPKQRQLGNFPVGSYAWNKSIQIALGMAANSADGVWGPQSQKMLDNFKMKNPKNFDAVLASRLKPTPQTPAPKSPAPGSAPSPVDY